MISRNKAASLQQYVILPLGCGDSVSVLHPRVCQTPESRTSRRVQKQALQRRHGNAFHQQLCTNLFCSSLHISSQISQIIDQLEVIIKNRAAKDPVSSNTRNASEIALAAPSAPLLLLHQLFLETYFSLSIPDQQLSQAAKCSTQSWTDAIVYPAFYTLSAITGSVDPSKASE